MEKIGRCSNEKMADRLEYYRGDIIFFNWRYIARTHRPKTARIFLAVCSKLDFSNAGDSSLQFFGKAY